MTTFYRMHGKHKKIIFSKSKSTKKIPGQVFLDFILLFHNAVERFSKSRISRFWVQILEF